jgi:hypothetical protein
MDIVRACPGILCDANVVFTMQCRYAVNVGRSGGAQGYFFPSAHTYYY